MENLTISDMPIVLAIVLIILCLVYMFAVTYVLTRKQTFTGPDQIDVVRKIRRYCKSIPRNESIPVAAIERLLDAIEYADTQIDIDRLVVDEIFKLKGK